MEQLVDLWRMVWRRFWIIAIVLVAGLPAVLLYAYLKLPLYRSEAKILVESQRIKLLPEAGEGGTGERLQQIQQRLMARDNIVKLIQELDLYTDRDDLTLTQKVGLVRDATAIVPIALSGRRARRGTELSAFVIRVTLESPSKAAALANRFSGDVLSLNIENRQRAARETTNFFARAQEALNNEIIKIEEEITRFKEANKDALPESLAFRQAELSRIGDAYLLVEQQLLGLEEERRTLLGRLKILERSGPPVAELTAEEVELRKLESELILKRATKAETHPEVLALQNRIKALKEAIAKKNPERAGDGPVMSTEEAEMRNRLVLIKGQVALLEGRKVKLDERRAELIGTLQRTPAVEIQLNALDRKLTEKQDQYSGYTRKRAEAEAAERLEVNQQAERFEMIESPIVPQWPIAPNRRKIVMMGSGMVIALALGLALLVDQMRPRIRTAGQLERQLGLRAVVTLPYVRTRAERRQRVAWRTGIAALVILGIPAGLYAIDRHYEPLPLLMAKLAEKSGADNVLRMIEKRF